jgi:hypothetical protein
MAHIIIPRTTEKREPAGHGQVPVIVCCDAQFRSGDVDCGRKAAVNIEHPDIVDRDTRLVCSFLA